MGGVRCIVAAHVTFEARDAAVLRRDDVLRGGVDLWTEGVNRVGRREDAEGRGSARGLSHQVVEHGRVVDVHVVLRRAILHAQDAAALPPAHPLLQLRFVVLDPREHLPYMEGRRASGLGHRMLRHQNPSASVP